MRKSKGLVFAAIMLIISCATNKTVVRDCTKSLMDRYRGESKQRIAIFPFMSKAQRKTPELNNFDEEIIDVVFEDRRLQVVERGLIEQISKEWTFSESGMVDEKQRSKIGRLSGAKLILVPIVSDNSNISMKIISVDTGDVLSYMRSTLANPLRLSSVPASIERAEPHHATPAAASTITIGSSRNGSIAQAGQVDRYQLNVRGTKRLEINAVKTDGSFDPIIELSKSSGEFIASDDDSGGDRNARLTRELNSGNYFIAVRAYQNNIGNYSLSVNEASNDNQYTSGEGGSTFGELLIQLETSVKFDSQTGNWRSRRSSWLSDVRSAGGDLSRLRDLVIEFETNILSSGQNSDWLSNSRSSWVSRVRGAGSIHQLAVLLAECESNIKYSAQSDSWRDRRSNWVSQVNGL